MKALVVVTLLALTLVGCGRADETDALTVFAAASLRGPLDAIGTDLTRTRPGLAIRSSYGGSSELVAQVADGAPADVLVTADERTMRTAVEQGLVDGEPLAVATNTMTIVVPKGNPAGIRSVADLSDQDLDVVACAPQVPCGAAAERVEGSAGVTLAPASEESTVTDVLGKVASGQADAGIVYVTDAARSDAVDSVVIPAEDNTTTRSMVAVLDDAAHPGTARELVDAILADADGPGHLRDAGFDAP